MIISSKNNPIVKTASALKEKKGRKEYGEFLVEGEKMSAECLQARWSVVRVFFSENYAGKRAEQIFSLIREAGLKDEKITYLSESAFACLSEEKTPQGVILQVKIPKNTPIAPTGDCLILDGVADPGNLGAIIRTANAAGYREIYLAECADAYSPKSVRASMSGIFFTKLFTVSREEICELMKDVEIVAADMGGENVFTFRGGEKIALAIGNEANGLSETVRKAASRVVAIPMSGTQESLNAGVAAAICMYELRREKFICG